MIDSKSQIEQLLQEYDNIDKQLSVTFKNYIQLVIQQLFIDIPKLYGINWHQYTPYFNDGEPCVFRVYEPDFIFKGSNFQEDKEYNISGWIEASSVFEEYEDNQELFYLEANEFYLKDEHRINDKTKEIIKSFTNLIISKEKFMQIAFGDHAEIIVTKDKIEVLEYEHE